MSTETENRLAVAVADLARLAEAVADGFDLDGGAAEEWSDYFGTENSGDPDDNAESLRESHDESILSIDLELIVSVVYGTGGPHREIEITMTPEGEFLRSRAVGYWGGDKAERWIPSEIGEAYADAIGLSEHVRGMIS